MKFGESLKFGDRIPIPHVISSTLGGRTATFGYDAQGRKTSEASSLGTINLGYDAAGGRTSITWPDGLAVTYAGNAGADLVTPIADNAGHDPGADDVGRAGRWTCQGRPSPSAV